MTAVSEMGCGVSNRGGKSRAASSPDDGDLKLTSCRLSFSPQQLLGLNRKFAALSEASDGAKDHRVQCLGVAVERLVQRLVCNVGTLDPRFSSKFLVDLEPRGHSVCEPRRSLKFRYLVRLDLVSTPALYPQAFEPPVRVVEGTDGKNLPQGYARIKVHGEFLEQWAGFISPHGFLRRDKVQERFVELLARAAARPSEPLSPAQVDESRLCGSPGKIVDPIALQHILNTPAGQQVFFGPAECNEARFPDPRDFRIAIVEGAPDTRLHVSFLSPTAQSMSADDVEISITLGIGVEGWPHGSDFPSRLPLDHVDVILGYRAAQLGYYLVPRGPHSSLYYEDRSSIWEIRTPATEMFLEHHYSPSSVVCRVYKTLAYLLEILKARGVKTINRYILKNLLFFELEHRRRMQQWAPKAISRRVVSVLDRLLAFLKNQMLPGYVFTGRNLLLQDDALEEDFISDSDILETYLRQLHNDGFKAEGHVSEGLAAKDELENVMLEKWENLIANMLPPMSNRSRRLGVVNNSPVTVSYTRQQMEYVAVLVREVLKLKNIQRRSSFRAVAEESKEDPTNREDFVYLLRIMFDQAKQKLASSAGRLRRGKSGSRKMLKLDRVLLSYDISTAMLVDDIRRDKPTEFAFEDDMAIVVKMMECLYKAIDSDGRVLGPVLRPYLSQIFRGSHENCCFLSEWRRKTDTSEFRAIGAFSSLVLSGRMTPLEGVTNSAGKGWNWAATCLQIMQTITEEDLTRMIIGERTDLNDTGLRLVFAPSPGKTLRVNVSLGKQARLERLEDSGEKPGSDSRYATIRSFQDVLDSAISSPGTDSSAKKETTQFKLRGEKQPPHVQLRDGNPFALTSMEVRRQGNHRGLGSIVQALISLQKLSILQEISQYLPEGERTRVLSDIKKLSKEVQRMAVERQRNERSCCSEGRNRFVFKTAAKTLPTSSTHHRRRPQETGVYRSLNEFSAAVDPEEMQRDLRAREKQLEEELKKAKEDTLLGTCRKLRGEARGATVPGGTASGTFPKGGRFRRGSSTFPKSIINTPFYIKVSSYESKLSGDFSTTTTSKL